MRRFWIDRSCLQGHEFILKGSLYHHICRVSQIQKNEPFELFAEGLQKYKVVLTSVGHSKAVAQIVESYPVPRLPKPFIHLVLSVPRLSKLDFIIEKAVELGVTDFHPILSSFSSINKISEFPLAKQKRLEKLIEVSSAVSGRVEKLKIHPLIPIQDLEIPKNHLALMAYEGEKAQSFKSLLTQKEGEPEEIWVIIGSEGGFSPEEAEDWKKKGGFLFSLGDQILRVETACLASLSILKYHYHNG